MDYKKIVKSRQARVKIMRALSFIPDKTMLKLQYRIKMGRKLNLDNPQRYTEKLQWYKLNYRDPLMAQCVDKYEVRKYVTEKGYASILNELYGVYDDPKEIDFDELPNQFVLKDTLGGGGNSVIICRDKSSLNILETVEKMAQWIKSTAGKHPGREWVYDQGKNRIIVEKYIPSDPATGGLIDYKFFCFNGKAAYVYGIADRKMGQKAGFGIYTPEFELLPYTRLDEKPLERTIEKPANYAKLLTCAETLAAPFPHARIDLYDQDGQILFGEITFFDGSGYMKFGPDEFDFLMGKAFKLPKARKQ
ncbi:ATP-grasp fold amidoligase family protein [Allofournierella sp.]|uniref:ATP-grasp fold amidoligase family protein n=1 Tax=Allofournierella sp. TaxID=1940256 RepID=UPI003AB74A15